MEWPARSRAKVFSTVAAVGAGKTAAQKAFRAGAVLGVEDLPYPLMGNRLVSAAPEAKTVPAFLGSPTVVEAVVEPEHGTLLRQIQIGCQ